MSRLSRFLRCPECGKRQVTLRLTGSEDHYGCRQPGCEWYAFTSGNEDADVRERARLAEANPDHGLEPDGINRW